jgi:hypothetical protein
MRVGRKKQCASEWSNQEKYHILLKREEWVDFYRQGKSFMASDAENAADQVFAHMGTLPRSGSGDSRSFLSEVQSERIKRLREDSLAFEDRLIRWSAAAAPENCIDELLLHENVCLSFELERVRRCQLERLRSRIENADANEREAAHELVNRLFFDPCGPTALYGSEPSRWREVRTSWNGLAVDPNEPAALVRKLDSSAIGCCLMLERWEELRAKLQAGGFWRSSDRLKAVRLLGRHPVDAADDRRVAEIFMASHALRPVGKAFRELRSDMGAEAHVDFVNDIKAQWPDLVRTDEPEKARRILIDLVDANVGRIEAILEKYGEEGPEEIADRSIAQLGFDASREGELIRRHQARCRNGLLRGIEPNRRQRTDGGRRAASDEEWWARDAGRRMPRPIDEVVVKPGLDPRLDERTTKPTLAGHQGADFGISILDVGAGGQGAATTAQDASADGVVSGSVAGRVDGDVRNPKPECSDLDGNEPMGDGGHATGLNPESLTPRENGFGLGGLVALGGTCATPRPPPPESDGISAAIRERM